MLDTLINSALGTHLFDKNWNDLQAFWSILTASRNTFHASNHCLTCVQATLKPFWAILTVKRLRRKQNSAVITMIWPWLLAFVTLHLLCLRIRFFSGNVVYKEVTTMHSFPASSVPFVFIFDMSMIWCYCFVGNKLDGFIS
jgi:hypothetical protein